MRTRLLRSKHWFAAAAGWMAAAVLCAGLAGIDRWAWG
jgi:hypothetical protein